MKPVNGKARQTTFLSVGQHPRAPSSDGQSAFYNMAFRDKKRTDRFHRLKHDDWDGKQRERGVRTQARNPSVQRFSFF